jgi:integrase/recombinase XerD
MSLVDDCLEFLEGRCRPNTVLAAAYDLRVFFTVVAKPAAEVEPADVLGFIAAQRTGRRQGAVPTSVDTARDSSGVATSTVARRLSIISGVLRLSVGPRRHHRESGAAGLAHAS